MSASLNGLPILVTDDEADVRTALADTAPATDIRGGTADLGVRRTPTDSPHPFVSGKRTRC